MANFPVFQFDQKAFPMLTPQQTSPLGGVLSDAIANRLKMAETRSKNTFADWAGSQAILKALENPLTAGSISNPVALTNSVINRGIVGNTNNQSSVNYGGVDDRISLSGLGRNIYNLITGNKNNTPVQTGTSQQPIQNASSSGKSVGSGILMHEKNPPTRFTPLPPRETSNPTPGGMPIDEVVPSTATGRTQENIDYGSRAASLQQQVEEGKATGKTFGTNQENQIKDLSDKYLQGSDYLETLNQMNNIITNPKIQKVFDVPFAEKHSMKWFKETSTDPEVKELLGQFISDQALVVQNFVSQFKGNATNKELDLGLGAKVNENDNPYVMIGKQEGLTSLTKFLNERNFLTADIMAKNPGTREFQARREADKQLNGDAIRKQVHDQLHPSKEKYYAKTIDEWHNGKRPESVKSLNNKRHLKIGGKWYIED